MVFSQDADNIYLNWAWFAAADEAIFIVMGGGVPDLYQEVAYPTTNLTIPRNSDGVTSISYRVRSGTDYSEWDTEWYTFLAGNTADEVVHLTIQTEDDGEIVVHTQTVIAFLQEDGFLIWTDHDDPAEPPGTKYDIGKE